MGALLRILLHGAGGMAVRMIAGLGIVFISSAFIKRLFDLGIQRFLNELETGSFTHTAVSLLAMAQIHTALGVILSAYAIVATIKASSALIKRSQ